MVLSYAETLIKTGIFGIFGSAEIRHFTRV